MASYNEPLAINKNCLNSLLEQRPFPSAMFKEIDKLALLSCEVIPLFHLWENS
jgi:hypothetical protein